MSRTLLAAGTVPPYSGPLLAWADGDFARTSEGSYQTAADAIAWAAAGARREDLAVFGETLTLIESQRTNLAISSESFSGWGATAGAVVTAAGATAPDGDADAANIFTNATNSRVTLTITLGASILVTLSRWVKNNSGDGSSRLQLVQKDGATTVDLASTATGTWVREILRAADTATGGSNPQYWHRGSASAGSRDIYTWGAQFELGRYETSYMRTGGGAFVRDADQATWLAAEVPKLLREKSSKIRCAPWWAHGDLVSGDTHVLYSWGVDDELRLRHDGSNIVLEAVAGGAQKATKTVSSITRRAPLWVEVDPVAGTVSWDGVSGSAGTPWAWPTGQFRLGGELGGSHEWDGGLDLPATVL